MPPAVHLPLRPVLAHYLVLFRLAPNPFPSSLAPLLLKGQLPENALLCVVCVCSSAPRLACNSRYHASNLVSSALAWLTASDSFTIIAPGPSDIDQDGPALVGDPDMGFVGLRQFGPTLTHHTELKVKSMQNQCECAHLLAV